MEGRGRRGALPAALGATDIIPPRSNPKSRHRIKDQKGCCSWGEAATGNAAPKNLFAPQTCCPLSGDTPRGHGSPRSVGEPRAGAVPGVAQPQMVSQGAVPRHPAALSGHRAARRALGASVPGEQDDGECLDDPSPLPGPVDPSDPSARGERVCAGLPQTCDRDTHPVPSPAPRHSPAEGCRAQAPRGKRMERPRCKRERMMMMDDDDG